MPAPDILNAESKLTALLVAFAETRRTAVGLPASSALPFYEGIRTAEMKMPCVVFHVPAIEHRHPHRIRCEFLITYETDSATTTAANEIDYLGRLRNAIADRDMFHAYLNALSSGNREGWWLRKYRLTDGGTEIDADTHVRSRYLRGWASFLISEVQPLAA